MVRVSRRTFIALGLATVLLLGGLATALLKAHGQSRNELEQRLGQRASVAAALIESTLRLTVQSTAQTAAATYSGRTVDQAAVRRATEDVPGAAVVVADARGRVLAAWPPATARRGSSIAGSRGVRDIIRGRPSAIELVPGASGRVATEFGFNTRYGRRIVKTVYPTALLQGFFTGYLERIADNDTDQAFVVARSGVALGSAGRQDPTQGDLPPGESGHFTDDGFDLFYASAPIGGTDWRVVLTVPEKQLYEPISGPSTWLPWVLFIGFAAMAAAALLLLLRLARGAARLHEANRELELRNEEVLASDRMKSDFLATMSHELRTPLNGIIGFAELMHDGRVGPVSEQHREYLCDILSSSNHLRRLIDDVLDLSKIEAGKMDLRPEEVELAGVVDEACDVMSSLAVRKRIRLEAHTDPGIGTVEVDPSKLRQVLFNYLSNAVKFTPEGGNVTVRAVVEDDDHYRILVEDDGPGIAPEDMERLWSAFEQLETGSSRRYGGTGLGLSLTRRIVEAQGGSVGVESTPGAGTCFWVVMPRVARLVDDERALTMAG
jgi:signal transduction histidine kinase